MKFCVGLRHDDRSHATHATVAAGPHCQPLPPYLLFSGHHRPAQPGQLAYCEGHRDGTHYPPPTFPSQGIIDLRNLARWPIVKDIVSAPVISQLLQAVLPTLALMVFLAIVPWLLR